MLLLASGLKKKKVSAVRSFRREKNPSKNVSEKLALKSGGMSLVYHFTFKQDGDLSLEFSVKDVKQWWIKFN